MRFACLGSGSRGNASLVEGGGVRLLVDCGFGLRELERRLAQLGVGADSVDAVLVTHEHGDHLRGIGPLSRKYAPPLWMTVGTCRAGGCTELVNLNLFSCHGTSFSIGGLDVRPFAVPHDAREPSQFVIREKHTRLGILTDSGAVTPHIVEHLRDCDALKLECNHDVRMLANGPYPPALQQRVGGPYGHLSNDQAAHALAQLDTSRLRHLVAAHLSEKNNHPDKAREALLSTAPGLSRVLRISAQDQGTGWLEI